MAQRVRRSPADRVRDRLRAIAGDALAEAMPRGYQRLGRVLLVRLGERYRPFFAAIGSAWQAELRVATVLVVRGPVEGEFREPRVERIAGGDARTEVREHGIRWRLDASRIMFAAGNRTERLRAGRLVRPGESVVDLFAGIGYFTIPAARAGASRVTAVEKNPVAVDFLRENLELNRVAERVDVRAGDNRTVPLPSHAADRVFLGYLPNASPWILRALSTVRPEGGWIHVHSVQDARGARAAAVREAVAAVGAARGSLRGEPESREVKPYGPGRTHVVVDAFVRPPG
jgi:tRNA wybutosine-synthesizing protein 2